VRGRRRRRRNCGCSGRHEEKEKQRALNTILGKASTWERKRSISKIISENVSITYFIRIYIKIPMQPHS